MKKFCALLWLFLTVPAFALEIAGVKLTDKVHLGSHELQLNGAGVRSKFFLDLYVAALYLPEKNSDGVAVLADGGEKRMALHVLRSVSAARLFGGISNTITANHVPAELLALDKALKEFAVIFHALDELQAGDVVTLDYLPENGGTQISLNGMVKGAVSGAPFYSALLKVWLGDNPAQTDLKQKLLGGQ